MKTPKFRKVKFYEFLNPLLGTKSRKPNRVFQNFAKIKSPCSRTQSSSNFTVFITFFLATFPKQRLNRLSHMWWPVKNLAIYAIGTKKTHIKKSWCPRSRRLITSSPETLCHIHQLHIRHIWSDRPRWPNFGQGSPNLGKEAQIHPRWSNLWVENRVGVSKVLKSELQMHLSSRIDSKFSLVKPGDRTRTSESPADAAPKNSKVLTKTKSFPDAQRPETLMCVFFLLALPDGISTKMTSFQLNNTHMRVSGRWASEKLLRKLLFLSWKSYYLLRRHLPENLMCLFSLRSLLKGVSSQCDYKVRVERCIWRR